MISNTGKGIVMSTYTKNVMSMLLVLAIMGSLLVYSVPPAADAVPPAAYSVPLAAYAVPPAASSVPPAAYSVPPAAYAVPPAAYSVPPAAYAVPPAAYAMHPGDYVYVKPDDDGGFAKDGGVENYGNDVGDDGSCAKADADEGLGYLEVCDDEGFYSVDSDAGEGNTITPASADEGNMFTAARAETVYTYTVAGGNATITGYSGPGGAVVVPGELDGYAVVSVAATAFRNNTALTSITLPASLANISNISNISNGSASTGAFEGCTNLAKVAFANAIPSSHADGQVGTIGVRGQADGGVDPIAQALGIATMPIDSVDALKGANPNFALGKEYRKNCQRCVTAYELRMRGYDVIAKPQPPTGNTMKCAIDAFDASFEHVNGKKELFASLATYPDGARFGIRQQWKGTEVGAPGHMYVAEKLGGKLRFYDPQNGDVDCSIYLGMARGEKFSYFRMDTADLKPGFDINIAVEARKP